MGDGIYVKDLKAWFDTKYAPKNLGVQVQKDEVDENQLDLFEDEA